MPLFNDRISPRFDACPEIWIIELENGEVVNEEKWSMASFNLPQRLDQLTVKRVDKIICGGIDSFSVDQLGNRGIDVIHNVTGEAKKVLNLFIGGVLRSGFYCNGKEEEALVDGKEAFGEGKRVVAKEKHEKAVDAICDTYNQSSSCSQQEEEAHAQERLNSKFSNMGRR